ncbi:NAD(+) diphosphatase [Microbacterium sp. STN6]|uniref:NAD(+) diphosphatase n=1 Tax=Microbacterium sp. STN6 TaxID=2995588 RepID=UPI002260B1E9|nr:NAD(+) diphosphatase [Microbacterium sp. STN6]MCX7521948.1 NAD(+) diphosphatase [Microbacterium sp. STN6]
MGALPHPGLSLAYPALDRDGQSRSHPDLFDELWSDESTRILPLWQGRALLRDGEAASDGDGALGDNLRLDLRRVDDVTSALTRVYLGRTRGVPGDEPAGAPIVVSTLTDAAARELEPDESRWAGLRDAAPRLSARDAGIFVEALAIVNWHIANTHCSRCGMPTVVEQGGWVRRCFQDDALHFPRTDAAVIVAVTDDDDRLLLGSNLMWESDRFSLLAGFVEPGESFEAAAVREIGEEAGIRLTDVAYEASQPWPFPASIMVGMHASLASGQTDADLRPDGEEIRELRFFSRADLWAARESVRLPGTASIAHALIEGWYGGPLDAPPAP